MGILDIIIIFLGILFKYLLCYGISQTILYGLLLIICLLTLCDIYHTRFKRTEFNKILIFLAISVFFIITQRDVNFFISTIFAIIITKKDEKSFVKTFFFSSIILFITTIILNELNLLTNHDIIRNKGEQVIKRYSLGFDHPNTVFLYFLPIALCGYYLYHNKLSYYIMLILTSTILYKLCNSRTGYICILGIIVLQLLTNKKILNNAIIKKLINHSFLIFTLLTIIMCILFGQDLTNIGSKLLSGRPYYLNYYLKNNLTFTLLGGNYIKAYYLDNFYFYILVQLGLVGFFIYYLTYKKGIKCTNYEKKYIVILLIFLIYGLAESNVIIGSINFLFAIFLKAIIITKKKDKSHES